MVARINITTSSLLLKPMIVTNSGQSSVNVPYALKDSILGFQAYVPINELSCLAAEGPGTFDAWILFGKTPDGKSGFSVPGFLFYDGFPFIKQ